MFIFFSFKSFYLEFSLLQMSESNFSFSRGYFRILILHSFEMTPLSEMNPYKYIFVSISGVSCFTDLFVHVLILTVLINIRFMILFSIWQGQSSLITLFLLYSQNNRVVIYVKEVMLYIYLERITIIFYSLSKTVLLFTQVF